MLRLADKKPPAGGFFMAGNVAGLDVCKPSTDETVGCV